MGYARCADHGGLPSVHAPPGDPPASSLSWFTPTWAAAPRRGLLDRASAMGWGREAAEVVVVPALVEASSVEQAAELWVRFADRSEVVGGRLVGGPVGLAASLRAEGVQVRPAVLDPSWLSPLEAQVADRSGRPAPAMTTVVRLEGGGLPALALRLQSWPGVREVWWDDGRPPPPVDLAPDTQT
jgi:hypothetical protein